MYNISTTPAQTYNKKLAEKLVLKIKALTNILEKHETGNEEIRSTVNREKNKKVRILIKVSKKYGTVTSDKEALIRTGIDTKANDDLREIMKFREIKKRMNEDKITKMKFELFNLMSKVVVKNINNYLNLAFNSPVTEKCLSRDEMQGEAWIILENCIDKFKVNNGFCFYFYYNKALGRNFYRMFFNTCQDLEKFKKYSVQKKNTTSHSHFNSSFSMDILIDSLDLSEMEHKVLQSKLRKEKKSIFLAKHPEISSGRYYGALKNIKALVQKLKDNGQL